MNRFECWWWSMTFLPYIILLHVRVAGNLVRKLQAIQFPFSHTYLRQMHTAGSYILLKNHTTNHVQSQISSIVWDWNERQKYYTAVPNLNIHPYLRTTTISYARNSQKWTCVVCVYRYLQIWSITIMIMEIIKLFSINYWNYLIYLKKK